MKLNHDFAVPLPVEQAWQVLTDLERIAPCMPGVHLDGATDDGYRGGLTVKVGPITAAYTGEARFVTRDEAAHQVVWQASGKETRGKGGASATVTMELSPSATGTHVTIATDLSMSGRLAQFGRGVITEVSNNLLAEFVHGLGREIAGTDRTEKSTAPVGTGTWSSSANLAEDDWPDDTVRSEPAPAPPAERPAEPQVTSLNLARVVAVPMAKRLVPVATVVVILLMLVWRGKRRA
jgi:uncharacterized protein